MLKALLQNAAFTLKSDVYYKMRRYTSGRNTEKKAF